MTPVLVDAYRKRRPQTATLSRPWTGSESIVARPRRPPAGEAGHGTKGWLDVGHSAKVLLVGEEGAEIHLRESGAISRLSP
jgi:hypothetical protein